MKTKILFFLTMLSLVACSKDIEQEPDKLPDATMIGANTAGCYINGQLIIAKNGVNSMSGFINYGLIYLVGPNFAPPSFNDYFSITFANFKNKEVSYTVYIYLKELILGIGLYNVGQSNGERGIDGPNNSQIIVNEVKGTTHTGKVYYSRPNSGTINITHFDYPNKIYSGTFNCIVYNINNPTETILIAKGRFDINGKTLNQ